MRTWHQPASHTADEHVDIPEVTAARASMASWCGPTSRTLAHGPANHPLEYRHA